MATLKTVWRMAVAGMAVAGLLLPRPVAAQTAAAPSPADLEFVDFRGVPLSEALRLLQAETALNAVASAEAGKVTVTLQLRQVPAAVALEELCRTNNLWQRRDPATGIVRIMLAAEFQRELGNFREETTEVITLLYPNAVDAALAIRNLYGERVELSLGAPDQLDKRDLQERLDRFDIIDQRSQGLGVTPSSAGNAATIVTTGGNSGGSSGGTFENYLPPARPASAAGMLAEGGSGSAPLQPLLRAIEQAGGGDEQSQLVKLWQNQAGRDRAGTTGPARNQSAVDRSSRRLQQRL